MAIAYPEISHRLDTILNELGYGVELCNMALESIQSGAGVEMLPEIVLLIQGNFIYDAELVNIILSLLYLLGGEDDDGKPPMSDQEIYDAWMRAAGKPKVLEVIEP